jgi:addiction module RelE/StbE family toxin
MKISFSKSFQKVFNKRIKNNKRISELFSEKLKLFAEEPYHPSLKTHKLTGKLKDYHSFRIDLDYRVIFEFVESEKVILIDIGTHDQVY